MMTRKITFIGLALCLLTGVTALAGNKKDLSLTSPDGSIRAEIKAGGKITYTVSHDGKRILDESEIALKLGDGTVLGSDRKVKDVKKGEVREKGLPAVAYKKAAVDDCYNWLTLGFKTYSVEFRAYDNGFAWRFVTKGKKGETIVKDEVAQFNFAQDWTSWVPFVRTDNIDSFDVQFGNSFENIYQHINLTQWDARRLAFLPVAVDAADGVKVCITESDLYDYPGMFLNGKGKNLRGVFATYPKEVDRFAGYNCLQDVIRSREDYIARTDAARSFPWRIVAIVPEARQLADLDLVWQLTRPADPKEDFSWVKPGKVAWDWWNAWNLYGVDFEAGINNETYKYYIDFASSKGIEYVILDEGWAVNKKADLFQVIPEIDLEELTRYAASKNVGLILWAGYKAVDRDIEGVFKHYAKMGIKGFKVDFMDRDDQVVMDFYERVAATAAKYHLVIDFHGAFKPQGLSRKYPNVLNYEGVHGLEHLKWSDPTVDQVTYDVTIPFIRMVAGSMDYTQGAMRNATKGNYRPVNSEAMSQGTRCRQLAEYAVFDAPLTMLCDSPSNYLAEPECTDFIASFPTTWDETVPLCGEIGEYVAIARRKGDTWYVGAMTDWNARDLTLDLSFIGPGARTMTAFQDGVNAHRAARDYRRTVVALPADGQVKIHMAPGGGWAAKIEK